MSRSLWLFGLLGISIAGAVGAACSPDDTSGQAEDDDQDGSGGDGSGGSGIGGFDPTSNGGAGGGGPGPCDHAAGQDGDMDGFPVPEDCNDCDANVNPGAIEVLTDDGSGGAPAEPSDEDCDGMVDNVLPTCDDALTLDSADPMDGAKAIDLCQQATAGKWGVMSAAYVLGDGSPIGADQLAQWGILDNFGPAVNAQGGTKMLVLSTGHARLPGQPNVCTNHQCTNDMTFTAEVAPPGYPQAVPGCDQATEIYDDIGLEVKIKSPKNAKGYTYLFKFYSFEFAEYVCTQYNDQYIALVTPPPMGSQNGNISFDSMGNPVSVNIAFFDVCDPAANADFAAFCTAGCPAPPNPYCPSGPGELAGNGFDDCFGSGAEDAGATSWLQSTAPITGGDELTIRFEIWDAGDWVWDSTVVIDRFEWIATGGTPGVGTTPIPDPK